MAISFVKYFKNCEQQNKTLERYFNYTSFVLGVWHGSLETTIAIFDVMSLLSREITLSPRGDTLIEIKENQSVGQNNLQYKTTNDAKLLFYTSKKDFVEVNNIYPIFEIFNDVELADKYLIPGPIELESSIDSWRKTKNLSKIIQMVGLPHYVIGNSNGIDLFFYFGYHFCQAEKFICFLIMTVDRNNLIRAIYKYYQKCPHCHKQENGVDEEYSDIDYFH